MESVAPLSFFFFACIPNKQLFRCCFVLFDLRLIGLVRELAVGSTGPLVCSPFVWFGCLVDFVLCNKFGSHVVSRNAGATGRGAGQGQHSGCT